jgi:phospholipase/carboxylesterase
MEDGMGCHPAILPIGSTMKIDASSVLWSAPERERAGRPLLVLLHGYGSHEGDLFSLAPGLPLGPVIASVRAPLLAGPGHAWFPLSAETPIDEIGTLADAPAAAILDWLDTTDSTSIGLLGFSQGAAIALQLVRQAPERFAYTVALSGFVVSADHPGDVALAEIRPPVFWGRGTLDSIIPARAIDATAEWLPAHADATIRIYEGLGHGISNPELKDINSFISAHL